MTVAAILATWPAAEVASAGGFTRGEHSVSMQWLNASSPVAAVSPAGKP